MSKLVSVIMGIYNCEDTLDEAVQSVLDQTYDNWELILCNDGSSDGTGEVGRKYQEKFPERIKYIENENNLGLNKTLNQCLRYVKGEYIARMDGDDVSHLGRFEAEVRFLEEHPDIAIISTPMEYFDQNGVWGRGHAVLFPEPSDFIFGTPFCHAPCMIRKEALLSVGGYSENPRTLRAEDYDLWFRMYAKGFRGANLSEPYYMMRDDMHAYRRRKFRFCLNEAYVRYHGYRSLNLPIQSYLYVFRPIIVGLLPKPLYMYLHHHKKNRNG